MNRDKKQNIMPPSTRRCAYRVYIPKAVAEDFELRGLSEPPYDRIVEPGAIELSRDELYELFREAVYQGWYTDAWDDRRAKGAYRRLARDIAAKTGWEVV